MEGDLLNQVVVWLLGGLLTVTLSFAAIVIAMFRSSIADVNRRIDRLTEVIERFGDHHVRLDHLTSQVDHIEKNLDRHETMVAHRDHPHPTGMVEYRQHVQAIKASDG